jgi:XTP/dITP diphosphohydrolase
MSERSAAADPPRPRLVIATGNKHKLAELTRILAASGTQVELAGLADYPGAPEVAETGATFAENALLKARAMTWFTGLPAVADDSGLCVDALNGMPGVLSARWAGRHGDDQANLRLVLAQVADVPDDRRGAQFACAAALVLPSGPEHVAVGTVGGRLIREPRGSGGFGYDPVFVPDPSELEAAYQALAQRFRERAHGDRRAVAQKPPPEADPGAGSLAGLTTAQMPSEAKDAISHRGRALRALAPAIAEALDPG